MIVLFTLCFNQLQVNTNSIHSDVRILPDLEMHLKFIMYKIYSEASLKISINNDMSLIRSD